MKSTVPVDVVIPLYNTERYIQESVRSVLSQTAPPHRLVVVDDGSTDHSAARVEEVIAAYNGPTRIELLRTANGGLSAARNKGIARCTSDYVAFLDADDVWMPIKLARQMELFAQSEVKDLVLVHTDYHLIDTEGNAYAGEPVIHPSLDFRGDVFLRLLKVNLVSGSGSAVLARRAAIEQVGGFDENLKAAEDWDMWLRLSRLGGIDHVPADLVAIRRHASGMQADASHMLRNMIVFFTKWFPEAVKNKEVVRYWGHLIAEFALRTPHPLRTARMTSAGMSAVMKQDLFARALGSLPLYVAMKSGRRIFTNGG